jgi:regulator of RNase E activity RraA
MKLADRLALCYTGAVYDVMRDLGGGDCALPPTIRPLDPARKLAGPVWTAAGRPAEGADHHATLLSWTGLLSAAPAGHVVVCQPNDSTIAHMGELSAEALKLRGVLGYVCDGGCRDVAFIQRMGFPVFSRYYTPRDVVGRWLAVGLGEAIEIGGIAIATGDYLLGDQDGVVIIPAAMAEQVIDETERIMSTESAMRDAILAGMDPQEAYLKFGVF